MRKIAFVLSVLSVWCSLRAAERLVVVAGSDHEPLAGATVLTRAGIIAGLTDSCGVISGLSASDYPLSVRYLGFKPGTAAEGTDTLRMEEEAFGLNEVVVTPKDRPVLKLTLYIREYACRTIPGDTLIMFNEHMANCYIPTAKTKFRAVRVPQIRASRCYNREATALGDTVYMAPKFDDMLSWTEMIEFPAKKLSDDESHYSDLPFQFMHKPEDGTGHGLGNDVYVVSRDYLAKSKNHRESPGFLKLLGLTTDFFRMDEAWAYRAKSEGTYYPEEVIYGTFNFQATIRGKLFKKLIKANKDIDMLSYIELYVVDAVPMTAAEAKADKKDRSAVPEFIISPLAPPLEPAIQAIVDRAGGK